MVVIRIQERVPGTESFQAVVSFNHGSEYPITVTDPFSQAEEERLAWYFEEYLEFPFTKGANVREAAASITTYGEALFKQVFADNSNFHACIDDKSNSAFDQATAHGIPLRLPLLVIAQLVFLRLQISDGILQKGRHISRRGAPALQMRQCLFPLPFPEQREEHLILLFAPGAMSRAFARLDRTQRIPDLAPQIGPVQDLDRVGKVLIGLGFDPLGPISEHDLLPGLGRFQFTGSCIGQLFYTVATSL